MGDKHPRVTNFLAMAGSLCIWALFLWILLVEKPKALSHHVGAVSSAPSPK